MADSFDENYGAEDEPPLPPPPTPGTKHVPPASPKAAAKLESVAKLNFRAWLWLQHHRESEYAPLARLILSGGPENVWVNKPLNSAAVAFEISQMYASHREGITSKHVHLANKAVVAYRDDDATVEDLMSQREAEEKEAEKFIRELETKVLEDELGDIVPSYEGKKARMTSEAGLVRVKCGYINRFGKGCSRQANAGIDRCDIHGGMYFEPEELKEILQRGQEQIVAASGAAIEAVVDLMQNSVQDAIRLKAAEMLLDRAGFRPGMEITVTQGGETSSAASPADLVRERLSRLKPQTAEVVKRTEDPAYEPKGSIVDQDGNEVA